VDERLWADRRGEGSRRIEVEESGNESKGEDEDDKDEWEQSLEEESGRDEGEERRGGVR